MGDEGGLGMTNVWLCVRGKRRVVDGYGSCFNVCSV